MEKIDNNSGNSKKYRFYRKPSIKKKGPEIKHTKTSLARLLKVNPLLKLENDDTNNKKITNVNRRTLIQKYDLNKPIITVRSGPSSSNSRVPSFSEIRLSVSDFNKQILSSTMISAEDDVFKPDNKKQQTQKSKASSINNEQKENKCPKRKSLSSQYKENKLKEVRTILKNSIGSTKRRSRSLESIMLPTKCYRIEEERSHQNITGTQSEENLSTMRAHADTPYRYVKPNSEDIDEENKENVDTGLVDAESYEALFIQL